MGLSESKFMIQKLSYACENAEKQGSWSCQLNGFLQDPHIIQYIQTAWLQIPKETQQLITGKKSPNPLALRRKRKKAVTSVITIPESVASQLSRWTLDSHDFLRESQNHDVNWEAPALVLFYQLLIYFEHRRDNDLIRSRFLKVIFYALKESMGLQRLHAQSVEAIAQIISGSQLGRSSPETIKSHLSDWSNEGKKLDNLCRDIHEDINDGHGYLDMLFCLPKDVGKEYLRVLPQNGKERDYQIQQLRERGILAVERLEELTSLADEIYRYLWTCLDQIHVLAPNRPTDHIFMALEHTGSQNFQLESTPYLPYPCRLELSSSQETGSVQGALGSNSTLSSETRDMENCYIPDQNLQTSAQSGVSVIHSPSSRNSQTHQVSRTDRSAESYPEGGNGNLVPFDPSEYIHPMSLPVGSAASYPEGGNGNLVPFDPSEYIHPISLPIGSAASYPEGGNRNLVPFDPSEYIHPMSLPVGSAESYLEGGNGNLVPFDPSEYIHPMSLLDRPVALYPEGESFGHSQYAAPSYESITMPLEATRRAGRSSRPAEPFDSSNVGFTSQPQAESGPCLPSVDLALPQVQG
ncbi:unnamed protein product [Penicillium viridicatum]